MQLHYSNYTKTCSTLETSKNLNNLFNGFNNVSPQQNRDTENINCKYCNIDEIQSISNLNHKDALSFFHICTCSLSKTWKNLNISHCTKNENFH